MRNKIFLLTCLFFLITTTVFASWDKKPELRWSQLYRCDIQEDDQQLYISRLSSTFNYLNSKGKPLVRFTPFYEMRRNIRWALWERQELGMEISKDIFPWFYLGQVIQGTWLKEEYRLYTKNKTRRPFESETRLMLVSTVLSKNNLKVRAFLCDEYTYDFDIGAGVRNEVAAGVIIPAGKYLEAGINWRHIDRIHDFDSDAAEISATLVF